jgi:DNA-binding MarR family transcriptional regulator
VAQLEAREKLETRLTTPDLDILKLPAKIFEPHRLLIMKDLYLHGQVEFRQLKHGLGLSDGNLFSHLRALEQGDYIVMIKEIVDKKIRTTYEMTAKGRTEFGKLINALSFLAKLDEFQ